MVMICKPMHHLSAALYLADMLRHIGRPSKAGRMFGTNYVIYSKA